MSFLSQDLRATADKFEGELEVFRTEVAGGTQFFNAYLAVHAAARNHPPVHELLNRAPLFWNTCLAALQTATFIALGRLFDQDTDHNVDRVIGIAQDNPQIFSRIALGRRRQGDNAEPPEWLDKFLKEAYEPTAEDFRLIRKAVSIRRRVYEENYRDLRNKVFAHKIISDTVETAELFSKTNIEELQRLFGFFGSLHEALRELFQNGQKPDLPLGEVDGMTVKERITQEAEQFLVTLSAKN